MQENSNIQLVKMKKHCSLQCSFGFQAQKLVLEKRPQHRIYNVFFPPRTKQGYLRWFLTLGAAKSSQHIGCNNEKASVANLRTCPTMLLHHLFKNNGIYNVLRKHMHTTPQIPTYSKLQFPWQQAKTSKNIDNCSVSGQWQGRQEENID